MKISHRFREAPGVEADDGDAPSAVIGDEQIILRPRKSDIAGTSIGHSQFAHLSQRAGSGIDRQGSDATGLFTAVIIDLIDGMDQPPLCGDAEIRGVDTRVALGSKAEFTFTGVPPHRLQARSALFIVLADVEEGQPAATAAGPENRNHHGHARQNLCQPSHRILPATAAQSRCNFSLP